MNQYYYQGHLVVKPMTRQEAEQLISLKDNDAKTDGYAICLIDSLQWIWVSKKTFDHMINKKTVNPVEDSQDILNLGTSMTEELYKKINTISRKKNCDEEQKRLIYRINRQICIINKIFNQINQKFYGKTVR